MNSPCPINSSMVSRSTKWYAIPSSSPGLGSWRKYADFRLETRGTEGRVVEFLMRCVFYRLTLVVWETEKPNLSGYSSINFFIMVDLPDPEGPQRTRGFGLDIFIERPWLWNFLSRIFVPKPGKRLRAIFGRSHVSQSLNS